MSIQGVVKTVLLSAVCAVPFLAGGSAHAAVDTCTWTGGGVNEDFSNSANWTGCDNGNVPESGDSLILPAAVDANTVNGNNRVLNNDLVSASFAGISVTGSYITGDYDNYVITGNAFSMSGDIDGNATTVGYPVIEIDVDMTVTSPATLYAVISTGSLAIGSNAVTLDSVSFDGGLGGSGTVSIGSPGGGQSGGGCPYGTADPAGPFGGDSSAFTGAVILIDDGSLGVTSRSTDLARHASSITLSQFSSLYFTLDNGQDMTFATPLTLNSGSIYAHQLPATADCDKPSLKTLTITSSVTATAGVELSAYGSNVTLNGSITGSEYLNVLDGQSADETFTIGSVAVKSALRTTFYTVADNGGNIYATTNQVHVVGSGSVLGATMIDGGVLKGTGTVGLLSMSSGTVAPGLSPGCLTSGSLTYTGGSLEIELEGATVCTQYDQQIVNGTVDLGTATTLNILKGSAYSPALNSVYTIISNDASDPVTGTFAGLTQGATVVLSGYSYRISYTGGDGNDVTLTVVAVPAAAPVAAPSTGFSRLTLSTILPIFTIIAGVTLFTGKRILALRKI